MGRYELENKWLEIFGAQELNPINFTVAPGVLKKLRGISVSGKIQEKEKMEKKKIYRVNCHVALKYHLYGFLCCYISLFTKKLLG